MVNWNLVGFVKASDYRLRILFALVQNNKTPIELKTELKLYITHISTTLKELVNKGLVECLTPELKKGRIFALTQAGKEIVAEISPK
jgi:predicted transcriptional regulator